MKKISLDDSLKNLDKRSRDIFCHIVEAYLNDGEPVGSRNLSRLLQQTLSPATIRNVMSDLEHLGLIYAPHVSAGRMPTQSGLRFFVDAFMEVGDLPTEERENIENKVKEVGNAQSVEHFLIQASQILSDLSRGAGLVLATKQEGTLKHIEFVRLDREHALAILVTQKGDVENRIIQLPEGVTHAQLTEATNFLNAHIQGCTLNEAKAEVARLCSETRAALHQLSQHLVETGLALWGGEDSDNKIHLIVRGRGNLLEDVKAGEDLERLRYLFDDLETRESMAQLLDLADEGSGVRIFIGSENKLFSLSGSSLVVAPYCDTQKRVIGAVGVIGPTRLNYARIVPMVDYTAQLVSQLLR
ncbi:heat-inducible transcription repressor HrcA [Bartonella sp. CDC_skunk]|uniref:heat-inducible transcriptional repressor HrcA n=1 Tax=unclassified Bartonella TaxID=2645622 RepID=UPI00099A0B04|nr:MULTISPECIES: heat-inducible transcriptional repressor HrcA [unclassified Bartonella]AQX20713.1 heat-inducible transcription repressor HrcA [Bartonella sp. CDC_skunk]AQX27362.1 heat-inducible transcription repressor HrcA [Bartonella sp. Raccoon60]